MGLSTTVQIPPQIWLPSSQLQLECPQMVSMLSEAEGMLAAMPVVTDSTLACACNPLPLLSVRHALVAFQKLDTWDVLVYCFLHQSYCILE